MSGSALASRQRMGRGEDRIQRRYLVITGGVPDKPGHVVQVQLR